MKKSILHDIIEMTVIYVCFTILLIVFNGFNRSFLFILAGYFVTIGLIFFLNHRHNKRRLFFEKLTAKYKDILSAKEWTKVYLKPDAHEKIGIVCLQDSSDEKFYAKLDFIAEGPIENLLWVPYILVISIGQGDELPGEFNTIRYTINDFEELFTLHKNQVD